MNYEIMKKMLSLDIHKLLTFYPFAFSYDMIEIGWQTNK